MRKRSLTIALLLVLSILSIEGKSQDTSPSPSLDFSDKFFSAIQKKSDRVIKNLDRHTLNYLRKLERREKKLYSKLARMDSAEAVRIFGNIDEKYAELRKTLTKEITVSKFQNVYVGHIDSMKTMFGFLTSNQLFGDKEKQLKSVFASYANLQEKLNQTESIKKYLQARQQMLKQQIGKFGLGKEFTKYQQEVYYYKVQIEEYKNILNDPAKLEQKALDIARKIPAFQSFFAKFSDLGQAFNLSGGNPAASLVSYGGLQSSSIVRQDIVSRFGSVFNPSQTLQSGKPNGESLFNEIKNKVKTSNSEADLPDFKPNNQKSKSFWKRIELGTNIQTAKGNNFFPVTSDIGFSAGYKLNDKSIVGIGTSYKMGWGQSIRKISISHQGLGLRSFIDWKLKGSFYLSGGFEYNNQKPFNDLQQLHDLDSWQQSGLLGVSKMVSMNNKFFKKTKMQVLWDMLSYRQRPAQQPLKFRIGYNFK